MTEADNTATQSTQAAEQTLDDRGTGTLAGLEFLKRLRDSGFDADNEKFALALGRPLEEIEAWMDGSQPPDDDIIMKARGIAQQRGVTAE